jgi:predicted HTH transcriptional regulator
MSEARDPKVSALWTTAIREALVNVVARRGYSSAARGSHLRVKLFNDRLEIAIPGGLDENISVDTLEEAQSARNRQLVRMLQDIRLVREPRIRHRLHGGGHACRGSRASAFR